MRQKLIWQGMQVIEKMERETGLEPATSSLGIRSSFDNKELLRPWRHFLNIDDHAESVFCDKARLNAVIAVTSRWLF
jgi:hypothetical protein